MHAALSHSPLQYRPAHHNKSKQNLPDARLRDLKFFHDNPRRGQPRRRIGSLPPSHLSLCQLPMEFTGNSGIEWTRHE